MTTTKTLVKDAHRCTWADCPGWVLYQWHPSGVMLDERLRTHYATRRDAEQAARERKEESGS